MKGDRSEQSRTPPIRYTSSTWILRFKSIMQPAHLSSHFLPGCWFREQTRSALAGMKVWGNLRGLVWGGEKRRHRGPWASQIGGHWPAQRCHTDGLVIVGRRSICTDLTRIPALLSVTCHLTSRSSSGPLRHLYPFSEKHRKDYKIEIKDPEQTCNNFKNTVKMAFWSSFCAKKGQAVRHGALIFHVVLPGLAAPPSPAWLLLH